MLRFILFVLHLVSVVASACGGDDVRDSRPELWMFTAKDFVCLPCNAGKKELTAFDKDAPWKLVVKEGCPEWLGESSVPCFYWGTSGQTPFDATHCKKIVGWCGKATLLSEWNRTREPKRRSETPVTSLCSEVADPQEKVAAAFRQAELKIARRFIDPQLAVTPSWSKRLPVDFYSTNPKQSIALDQALMNGESQARRGRCARDIYGRGD